MVALPTVAEPVTAQAYPIAVQEQAIAGGLPTATQPASVFPTGPELARVIVHPAAVEGTGSAITVYPAVPEPAAVAGSEEARAALMVPARVRAAVEALQASELRVVAVEVEVLVVAAVAVVVAAVGGGDKL